MFRQKKKPKRKPQKKVVPPKHIEENAKTGEYIAKGVADGIAQEPKKAERKKPEENNLKIDPKKEFLKAFNHLTNRHRSWNVWRDFIVIYACALSNPVNKEYYDKREALYLRTIKKYNKQEQPLFSELAAHTVMALDENPEQDFLGSIYMSLNLGNQHNGQFFTPYDVCKLMAEVSMQDSVLRIEKEGYITINDPCCGAGATLIAGVHAAKRQLEKAGYNYQNHVLVVAQDIDMTVALMCYIQLSLLGVAGYVKVGNSLTDLITENDSKENYWFTPMYFSDIWKVRRALKRINALMKGEKNHEQ